MEKITVLIPSKTREDQALFLEKSVGSVLAQSVASAVDIRLVIALDPDQRADNLLERDFPELVFINSLQPSQVSALNAAIDSLQPEEDGYIAFLEDDDEWMPDFLGTALATVRDFDFLSSTQLEVDVNDNVLRINDFPTPSGWFMPASTLRRIGRFNEQFRFHLDNEWLGRLTREKLKRVHLVESTAPINRGFAVQVRPWLAKILDTPGGRCRLGRHMSSLPLVKRLVHTDSGMYRISDCEESRNRSQQEYRWLIEDFGAIPW